MALQKSKELVSGVSGNYWKVSAVDVRRIPDRTMIEAVLYKDATARAADKGVLETMQVVIVPAGDPVVYPFSVAAMNETNPIDIAYAELKKREEFSGSTDV